MSPEPMPWSMLLMFAMFWLYGLWPALRPEHFRQTCVRYMRPRSLEKYAASAGQIRVFGIIFVILAGVTLVSGVYSRF
jgi:hypothetical protein